MKTKVHITIIIILVSLSVIIGITSLFILPDIIPVHYGPDGSADRYGSKFEELIFPITSILIGICMPISAKYSSKKENNQKNNEKAIRMPLVCIFGAVYVFSLRTI